MKQNNLTWSGWQITAVLLFILWLTFVLAAYYVAQKPLDASLLHHAAPQLARSRLFALSAKAAWRTLLDIISALWLIMLALGLGLSLWHRLRPAKALWWETMLFSWGLGFGLLGLIILLIGLAGWLKRPFLFSLTILLTLTSLPSLRSFWQEVKRVKRPFFPITLYLALATSLAFTTALLPPTSWDSLSYHLRGPALYLQAGRIYPDIDIFSLNNPFLLEMVFLLALALRSDIAAQLIHFFFLPLLIVQVYVLATHSFKLTAGWTAVLLLFTIPITLQLAPTAYNDLALTFTILATLYSYLRWHETSQDRWLLLSGLFSGLSMSLKYTSFIAPLLIGLLLIAQQWRQPRQLVRLLLLFAAPTLLVALPWYIKNWAFTGNPVYPFVWNGRFWDDFRTNAHQNPGSGIGWNLTAILTLPYSLTLGINDASGDGAPGPLFLAFLPLLLLHFRRQTPLAFRILLAYTVLHYGFWVLGVINSAPLRQGRLLFPALVALCPILAWVMADLKRFDHPLFSLHRFLNLILATVLCFGLVSQTAVWLTHTPFAHLISTQSRADYLEQQLGHLYNATATLDDLLPSQAVVQFLWEPRTYYCQLTCRGDHILDKYAHLEHLHATAPAIAHALAAEGVTHLLIYEQGLTFLRNNNAPWVVPANEDAFAQFRTHHTRPLHQWDNAYTLVELIP